MLSLIGSILGFGTSFLPKVMDYFQDKADKKHELAMIEKQAEAQAKIMNAKLEITNVEMDSAEANAARRAEASVARAASKWVVNLSASVRPIMTYLFFVEFMALTIAVFAGWMPVDDYNRIWNNEMQAIWAAVVSFWFGARELRKREGKA